MSILLLLFNVLVYSLYMCQGLPTAKNVAYAMKRQLTVVFARSISNPDVYGRLFILYYKTFSTQERPDEI